MIGQACTGSGKTLAFGIPLGSACGPAPGGPRPSSSLPTRELASQVAGVVARLGRGHRLRVVELVGGRGYEPQQSRCAPAPRWVGTPGRVIDHLDRGTPNLARLSYFVLDEADEMLDQGFGPAGADHPAHAGPRARTPSSPPPSRSGPAYAWLLHNPAEVRMDDGRPAGVAPESVEHLVYDVPEGTAVCAAGPPGTAG